ncbi:hypothetical protein Egran_00616 [Elaphomyces granulatus]|uniref:Uncharacterized protein n=1 Tax=Elaphomyces granulatus TaxID=519963 RepID=A0A232M5F2_9EURO|nr:hypothetical protein Egran_00616 [Elaphomyces granulatus]
MHFSLAAVVLAGVALASPMETIYTTEKMTITSCSPTVTNCPANSAAGAGSYSSAPAGYSAPPAGYSAPPAGYSAPPAGYSAPPASYPAPSSAGPGYVSSSPSNGYTPLPPPPSATTTAPGVPVGPSSIPTNTPIISVLTISTCVPTVTYSTVTIFPTLSGAPGAPAGTPSSAGGYAAAGTPSVPPSYPAGTSSSAPAGSGLPVGPSFSASTFTGAASSVSNSFLFAGVAAVAAVLFA